MGTENGKHPKGELEVDGTGGFRQDTKRFGYSDLKMTSKWVVLSTLIPDGRSFYNIVLSF